MIPRLPSDIVAPLYRTIATARHHVPGPLQEALRYRRILDDAYPNVRLPLSLCGAIGLRRQIYTLVADLFVQNMGFRTTTDAFLNRRVRDGLAGRHWNAIAANRRCV